MSTEQTVRVIEAVGEVVNNQPEAQQEPNYWWLLSLAIIPVILGWWLNKRKQ